MIQKGLLIFLHTFYSYAIFFSHFIIYFYVVALHIQMLLTYYIPVYRLALVCATAVASAVSGEVTDMARDRYSSDMLTAQPDVNIRPGRRPL